MKISKKIIANLILSFIVISNSIVTVGAIISVGIPNNSISNNVESISSQIYKKEKNEINALISFKDDDINDLSLQEIEDKILEYQEIQIKALELKRYAEDLNWDSNGQTIKDAEREWLNAQLALDFYCEERDKRIKKIEEEKWNDKVQEYPVAAQIWIYLKNLGLNDYVCAGILGNIMVESGNQTLNIQPRAKNGHDYYGICQWSKHYSEIWDTSLNFQLQFLRDTIKQEFDTFGNIYKSGFNYNSFLSLTDEKEAAKAFAKCYERCGSTIYSNRQNNATLAYEYFTN